MEKIERNNMINYCNVQIIIAFKLVEWCNIKQ